MEQKNKNLSMFLIRTIEYRVSYIVNSREIRLVTPFHQPNFPEWITQKRPCKKKEPDPHTS